MNIKREFPDHPGFDPYLTLLINAEKAGDTSYHNDACPCVTVNNQLLIYNDYPDEEMRENKGGMLFMVNYLDETGCVMGGHEDARDFETDDIELVKEAVGQLLKVDMQFYEGRETIDEWVERIGRIGAMKLHPGEFCSLEILMEMITCHISEMTEEMAKMIVEDFNKGCGVGATHDKEIETVIEKAYEMCSQ